MKEAEPVLAAIARERLLAIIRCTEAEEALRLCGALARGAIRVVEFSLTSPAMLSAVTRSQQQDPELLVGAGTVLDAEAASAAIHAGAAFLVTPTVAPDVIAAGRRRGVPVICGGLTPTELQAAHVHGADLVKVFPAATLGPDYLRAVLAPLPMLRLVPTGGIGVHNARAFLDAGAVAVAVGGELASPGHDDQQVHDRAEELLRTLQR